MTADQVHFPQLPAPSWPQISPEHLDVLIDDQVQDVFDRVGPVSDRCTDWRKSMVEPWHSLAAALDGSLLWDVLISMDHL